MKMEFSLKKWREYYDALQMLGQGLKDSQFGQDGSHPKILLSRRQKEKLEKKIAATMRASDSYLNECKIHPKPDLWKYIPSDPTTHPSSRQFAYRHLLSQKEIAAFDLLEMNIFIKG